MRPFNLSDGGGISTAALVKDPLREGGGIFGGGLVVKLELGGSD